MPVEYKKESDKSKNEGREFIKTVDMVKKIKFSEDPRAISERLMQIRAVTQAAS